MPCAIKTKQLGVSLDQATALVLYALAVEEDDHLEDGNAHQDITYETLVPEQASIDSVEIHESEAKEDCADEMDTQYFDITGG